MTELAPHSFDAQRAPSDQQLALGRIVFSMLRPAAVISATLKFPLRELTSFMRLSYFRELREQGATLSDAADSMEVSLRTAKRLAAELRSDFFLPEAEHTLARRIEFMTWAQALSLARITQLLHGSSREEVENAIDKLLDEGRLEKEEGRVTRYRASKLVSRLVDDAFSNRIGALNSLLQNVAETVERRFIVDDGIAFARTLNFRIRRRDEDELRAAYDVLLERLLELESRVHDADDAVPIRMSVLWAEVDDQA